MGKRSWMPCRGCLAVTPEEKAAEIARLQAKLDASRNREGLSERVKAIQAALDALNGK